MSHLNAYFTLARRIVYKRRKKGMCFSGVKHIPQHERNVLYAVVREKKQKHCWVWEGSGGSDIFGLFFFASVGDCICSST